MPTALTVSAVEAALESIPGWQLEPTRPSIHRTFRFTNFSTAWAFMSRCALEAERINHHPEWSNVWATVDVTLTTHDCDGLSQLDLDLAAFMNHAAAPLLAP